MLAKKLDPLEPKKLTSSGKVTQPQQRPRPGAPGHLRAQAGPGCQTPWCTLPNGSLSRRWLQAPVCFHLCPLPPWLGLFLLAVPERQEMGERNTEEEDQAQQEASKETVATCFRFAFLLMQFFSKNKTDLRSTSWVLWMEEVKHLESFGYFFFFPDFSNMPSEIVFLTWDSKQ